MRASRADPVRCPLGAWSAIAAFAVLFPMVGGEVRAQDSSATLRGRTVEAGTGRPLADVELVLGARRTTSGEDGRWEFRGVPPGRIELDLRSIGFAGTRLHLTLEPGADTTFTITLTALARSLDEMVVTGARREQRLADVVVTTEVISREVIEATGASDLASVLTEQTGIQFQEGHPSGGGVMLQGLGSERVLVLLDGQPLNGRISGNFDLARIPTAMIDRVEVVKGPQSSLYGSEAMGGVVNVITRKPPEGSWDGAVRILGGGSGRLDAGLSLDGAMGPLGAALDIGRRSVDRAPGQAEAAGTLAERQDASARLAWRAGPDVELDGGVLLLDERQRWPTGSLYQFADNTQASGRLGATWRLGAHHLRPAVHVSWFDHLARQSAFERPVAGTGDQQTQRLAKAELLYSGPVLGVVLDAGVEARQERITSSDGRIEGGDRTLHGVEPYAQVDWSPGRWSLVPGMRLSWSEQWGTEVTPRLAVRYAPTEGLALRAAVGRGFRAPDFKELYLQFTNDAAGYAVYGNPDLRPERSTNLSLGAEWTDTRLYGRVQGFWNDFRDFIETRPDPDGGALVRYRYANVSRGRTWGTELEAGAVLARLRLEAGYAWLATEDASTRRPLLNRPAHSGRVSASSPLSAGLRASVTGVYTGSTPMERDESGRVTGTRDAFTRIDARVARRLPLELELALGVDNMFDTRPARWADATGRAWYAGLSWSINPQTLR
jgi:outer membrane receptor for ferrienterochelin and colicins